MSEIKVKPKGRIKEINKKIVQAQKFKNNIETTKQKDKEQNNNAEDYASGKVQNDIRYIARKGTIKANDIGKKSLKGTQENVIKGKQKIETIKVKIKEKKVSGLKNVIDNNKKTIKTGNKQNIKTNRNGITLVEKEIKTPEQVTKNKEITEKISNRLKAKTANMVKRNTQKARRTSKRTVETTKKAVRGIISGVKTTMFAIIGIGWVAVLIILIIVLIGGFVGAIFNGNSNEDYSISQMPNIEIVLVAKAQIGNEGGDKFWQWYGFKEHVHWCACYVSWCANECGYIDKGIIPKFAACVDGINWFKERNEWHDRGESYHPIIGDIIFFDWYDESGSQDGISDHVGIVTRTDIVNRTIYTIEGNTNNKCAERIYSFEDMQVMGYGSPKY
ncbi:MAG: CHAP domain-containing protein [Clostridia bacterium]|nr:CHAP domain-containing protein [Clostridia bacterium]